MSKNQKRKQDRHQETNASKQEERREKNKEMEDKVVRLREHQQKEVRAKIAELGYADPLDPTEDHNQIFALTVEEKGEVYRLPLIDIKPEFKIKDININQVTASETKDSRVSSIKAQIEKLQSVYKKSGEEGKSALRSPIIVQQRFAGNNKDGVAQYTYHLLSGHNRRRAYAEYYDSEHVPVILVGELEREDGKPCDQDTKDRLTRKLRRDANPQIDSNQYSKQDIAKMVYDEVTASDSKLVVNSWEDLSDVMDEIFDYQVYPRTQCRKNIFDEFQKIDGTYLYCDMNAGTTASDMTDYGFPNPKKGKSLRRNNSIIEESGKKYVFMSTDTAGTHLENAIGTLIKKWGTATAFQERTRDEGIKDVLIHLKIARKDFDPEVASLRTARADAEVELRKWNKTFSMLNFPFRLHTVVFPQQLIGACTDSNSCVKL
jgi:hypothetical protein